VIRGSGLGVPRSAAPVDAIPTPRVLRCRRPGDSRTAPAGFPRLFATAYQLEAGGGQRGVHMFIGHRHGEVDVRYNGLDRPKHPASDSG
jgi:hypothetical protein